MLVDYHDYTLDSQEDDVAYLERMLERAKKEQARTNRNLGIVAGILVAHIILTLAMILKLWW